MRKSFIRLVLALVMLGSVWAFTAPQNDKYFEIIKNLDIFTTMYKEINANYVDDVNPNLIMQTGINAMLQSLDPYTVYYAEDQIEDVRTENTGQYGGIGARIGERLNGGVYVLMPDEGFAADKAGLKRGDELLEVNGQDIRNNYDKATQFLKGQSGSKLKLKVLRPQQGELDIELELEQVSLPNVPYFGMVNDEVGLVKLTGFRQRASREVKSAIRDLKKQGATKVVVDLRGNGGGLLSEAVNISNLFVDKGELIVTTKGKLEEMNAEYKTLNASYDTDIPVAVLINSSSASASEIVAGVIQDYDRGVIIGQRSFGKGLVQRTMPLSYNSQLKVTIAKYYTPSGRCIQALDYSNRNADGSVGKVADSLKTLFKTTNGRPVYDGGGVAPDFAINAQRFSPITISLLAEDTFFEFTNQYSFNGEAENSDLTVSDRFTMNLKKWQSGKEIEITDNYFNDFKDWLSTKDIQHVSPLKKELDKFKLLAEENGELETLAAQIENIEQQLTTDLVADIEKAKDEIVFLLKEELAGRLFLKKGQLEASFSTDKDLQKAIEVLSDTELLNSTLSDQE